MEYDEWLEYRLPGSLRYMVECLSRRLIGEETIIIVVEEEVRGRVYRFLYWWNKKHNRLRRLLEEIERTCCFYSIFS